MGTPEREGREKRTQEILETVMTKNFPKLTSDTKPQVQEVQRTPNRINTPRPLQNDVRHIIFKLQKSKDKEKNPERSQRDGTSLVVQW